MYYLGLDIGSSSIKAALVDTNTGQKVALVQEPEREMHIDSPQIAWAEQDPELWWTYTCKAIARLMAESGIDKKEIKGLGIAYQMHGLVLVDASGQIIRPSIIWCDSRAVGIGDRAYQDIGMDYCDRILLNSPGNFTASKLRWVKENEPEFYERIDKFMLPGDYIAYRLTGEINTTISGLSEGIFWDFKNEDISSKLLDYYDIDPGLLPKIVPTFGHQCAVNAYGAEQSGLAIGTPVLYRAGDQPNNALTLNVFEPGEVAATGGTSGVVYAVSDEAIVNQDSKINNFIHVNHLKGKQRRIGKLLCINGAGSQYRWLFSNLGFTSYQEMNELAAAVAIGSDGLVVLPFGNGAERMLENIDLGTSFLNLNLNLHHRGHLCRAALEGIAFAFVYGIELLKSDGFELKIIKAGNDNLFQAQIFSETIATLIGQEIEIHNTTGAIGAARAAGLRWENSVLLGKAQLKTDKIKSFKPSPRKEVYFEAYNRWKNALGESIAARTN